MTKVIVHGCNGKMGQVITQLCNEDPEIAIVAGIDVVSNIANEYPVFTEIENCNVPADVVIDFSTAKAMDQLLAFCEGRRLPLVLCTTGLSPKQEESVAGLSESLAILKSANMSLGINLLLDLVQKAAKILVPAGFDMEIVEMHHRKKLDAPSGTALALANALNEAMGNQYAYQFDRSHQDDGRGRERKKRDDMEIGIQAVRGGTIVGTHDVIFAGTDEVLAFTHTAYSKSIFGKGAIEAAKFLKGKPSGLYHMRDVIANR